MSDQSERQTRRELIDPALKKAGWQIKPFDPQKPLSDYDRCAVTEYPTDNGPADYALFVDGQVLGIVEAKKLTLGPQNVLTQAERYSKGATANPFDFGGFRVPFLYSTNGEVIWFHDVRHPLNRSRKIAGFHTPAALRRCSTATSTPPADQLRQTPNNHPRLRPYQIEANAAIEQAIADRKRQMLVAMATGTGKTFTMVNQVYRLMKSGVGQAHPVPGGPPGPGRPGCPGLRLVRAGAGPEVRQDLRGLQPAVPAGGLRTRTRSSTRRCCPTSYLTDPQPGTPSSTSAPSSAWPSTSSAGSAVFGRGDEAIDEDAEQLDIPIHAFDVIIADECHRGYTTAGAVRLAQHARPLRRHQDRPDRHARRPHQGLLQRRRLPLRVRAGRPRRLPGRLRRGEGQVRRAHERRLPQGRRAGRHRSTPRPGAEQLDLLEDERQFDAAEVEAEGHLARLQPQDPRGAQEVRPGARAAVRPLPQDPDLRRQRPAAHLPRRPARGHRPRRLRPGRLLRPEDHRAASTGPSSASASSATGQMPGIVVTVDMLSTGVDIPDLEFIVFLRPVKSRILFEQMLGRGTRKGEKFPDKSHFTVFDCFDGTLLEYFRRPRPSPPSRPSSRARTIVEIIEDIWQNRDRDYNIRCLVKRLQRIDKEMSGEARELFAAYIPDGDMGRYADELPASLRERLHRHDGAAARPGLPGPPGQLPARASGRSSSPSRPRTTVTLRVAGPRRRRQGVQARGLPGGLRPVRAGEPRPDRGDPHPAGPAAGLEHGGAGRTAAEARRRARALHGREPPEGPRAALPQGPGGHHLDGQARGPTSRSRC